MFEKMKRKKMCEICKTKKPVYKCVKTTPTTLTKTNYLSKTVGFILKLSCNCLFKKTNNLAILCTFWGFTIYILP